LAHKRLWDPLGSVTCCSLQTG